MKDLFFDHRPLLGIIANSLVVERYGVIVELLEPAFSRLPTFPRVLWYYKLKSVPRVLLSDPYCAYGYLSEAFIILYV